MIAIDTNILVRFLTRDDEAQYLKSVELFRSNQVLILDTVWMETEWVLRYAYDFPWWEKTSYAAQYLDHPVVAAG